jgi:hypothetical protein
LDGKGRHVPASKKKPAAKPSEKLLKISFVSHLLAGRPSRNFRETLLFPKRNS